MRDGRAVIAVVSRCLGFPGDSAGKESTCNVGDPGSIPGLGRSPAWRREWLPTPVFWPGEFHGLYSPWGHKESDTTVWLSLSLIHCAFFIINHSGNRTGLRQRLWYEKRCARVLNLLQSCLTLCKPVDCSPLGSSVHGILQARILEWVRNPSPVDLPNLRSLMSPALAGRFFTSSATWEAHKRGGECCSSNDRKVYRFSRANCWDWI